MMSTDNFTLLMAFLVSNKEVELLDQIKSLIINKQINWGDLLNLANIHLCTPFPLS